MFQLIGLNKKYLEVLCKLNLIFYSYHHGTDRLLIKTNYKNKRVSSAIQTISFIDKKSL